MKITDLKTYVVENPPPHYGGLYWVFIKLTTDNGVNGFGEAYSVPFHPQIVAGMIEDVCDRYVMGSDPFKIERLWRIIYSSGYTQRADLSIMGVLSAIEMACWDITGNLLGFEDPANSSQRHLQNGCGLHLQQSGKLILGCQSLPGCDGDAGRACNPRHLFHVFGRYRLLKP